MELYNRKGVAPVFAALLLTALVVTIGSSALYYHMSTTEKVQKSVERAAVGYYCEKAASLRIEKVTPYNITIVNQGGVPLHTKYFSVYIAPNLTSGYELVDITNTDDVVDIGEKYTIQLQGSIYVEPDNIVIVVGECGAEDRVMVHRVLSIIPVSPPVNDYIIVRF
ncbi:MAG: hypothetical protein B6U88_01970 [Candidatus Aenigmarchaeota archaeon ex4484_56]|nr:MAG: hypothetical protein B6U88_01970 [Candidatus Aenigmarchaeota archaeon ex4484_56]